MHKRYSDLGGPAPPPNKQHWLVGIGPAQQRTLHKSHNSLGGRASATPSGSDAASDEDGFAVSVRHNIYCLQGSEAGPALCYRLATEAGKVSWELQKAVTGTTGSVGSSGAVVRNPRYSAFFDASIVSARVPVVASNDSLTVISCAVVDKAKTVLQTAPSSLQPGPRVVPQLNLVKVGSDGLGTAPLSSGRAAADNVREKSSLRTGELVGVSLTPRNFGAMW